MGALTRNGIRVEDHFTSNFKTPSPNFDHLSKKPKLSPSAHQTPPDLARSISAKSTISRFFRYPEVTAQLKRQVHAPCRQTRFRFSANSSKVDFGGSPGSKIGNLLTRYQRAKESAFRCLRYVRKDEDVIEVVDNTPKDGDEEVEILDAAQNEVEERTPKPSSSSGVTDLNHVNMKVEIFELDNLELPAYKKLLDAVNKKDGMFKRMKFDIELHEKRLLQPPKKAGEVKEVLCLNLGFFLILLCL